MGKWGILGTMLGWGIGKFKADATNLCMCSCTVDPAQVLQVHSSAMASMYNWLYIATPKT